MNLALLIWTCLFLGLWAENTGKGEETFSQPESNSANPVIYFEDRTLKPPNIENLRIDKLRVSSGNVNLSVDPHELECFSQHQYCRLNSTEDKVCYCNEECSIFGDCCWDAKINQELETLYSCTKVPTTSPVLGSHGTYFRMVTKCPKTWEIQEIRKKCESTSNRDMDDLMAWVPVSNNDSNITYNNIYCALCHRDQMNIIMWRVDLNCTKLYFGSPTYSLKIYVNETSIYVDDYEKVTSNLSYCMKWVLVPQLNSRPKECNETDYCDYYWMFFGSGSKNRSLAMEYERKCLLYRAPVECTKYSTSLIYKNKFCAFCSGVKVKDLICYAPPLRSVYHTSMPSFSLLMDIDFSKGDLVGKRRCKPGYKYDSIKKKCFLVCKEGLTYRNGHCVSELGDHSMSSTIRNCVPRTNEQYFDAFNESSAELIDRNNTDNCTEEVEMFDSEEDQYVTLVCLCISMTCLVIKMILFVFDRAERAKLASRAVFCLSGTLFTAQLSFLVGLPRQEWGTGCCVMALLTHYSFLSSFHWTNVLSFDIWMTFCVQSAAPSSSSSGPNARKRFIRYALYSWVSPLVVVGIASLFEWGLPFQEWRPNYGSPLCWVNSRKGLLAFFALPLACLLSFNCIFFMATAYQIFKAVRESRFARETSGQDCIRVALYLKLALIMGLAWGLGFVAGFTDSKELSYAFIIMNGLQGAFILVAFTQFARLWRKFRKAMNRGKLKTSGSKPYGIQDTRISSSNLTRSTLALSSSSHATCKL